MNERELNCIAQRLAVERETHSDALELYQECRRLRSELRALQMMATDPAIGNAIRLCLEDSR